MSDFFGTRRTGKLSDDQTQINFPQNNHAEGNQSGYKEQFDPQASPEEKIVAIDEDDKHGKGGQEIFCNKKDQSAMAEEIGHHRVYFRRSSIDKMEGEGGIGDAEQKNCQDNQKGAIAVAIKEISPLPVLFSSREGSFPGQTVSTEDRLLLVAAVVARAPLRTRVMLLC